MQFSLRDGLWFTTVVALVLALLYSNRSPVTPPPVPAALPVGRYQLMSDPKSGYVFLLDSTDGKVWRYYGGEWSKAEVPVNC
jgi:hypothetical protein